MSIVADKLPPRIGTIRRVIADLRKGPWSADACALFANELEQINGDINTALLAAEQALAAAYAPTGECFNNGTVCARCGHAEVIAAPSEPAGCAGMLREALTLAREYVANSSRRLYDGTNGEAMRKEAARRLALIDDALAATQAQAVPMFVFEHDDGRYAVGPEGAEFTVNEPAWHRLGAVSPPVAATVPTAEAAPDHECWEKGQPDSIDRAMTAEAVTDAPDRSAVLDLFEAWADATAGHVSHAEVARLSAAIRAAMSDTSSAHDGVER